MSVQAFEQSAAEVAKHSEIGARFAATRRLNVELDRSLSPLEHVAVWVTDHVGTMGFFSIIAAWTIVWLGWNTLGPLELRFDPGPAFVLWLFISNLL